MTRLRPHKHNRVGESNPQRRRRNLMILIHNVMEVGEVLEARTIYNRICSAYPSGHQSIPKSTTQLGQIMRAEKSMEKITIAVNKYQWRRIK